MAGERTCSPKCLRCEWYNYGTRHDGEKLRAWIFKPYDNHPKTFSGEWLIYCPSCGVHLMEREELLEGLCPETEPLDPEGGAAIG